MYEREQAFTAQSVVRQHFMDANRTGGHVPVYVVMHKLIEFETQKVMHTNQVSAVITSRKNGQGLAQSPK